jgi:hypothetical protein
MRSTPTRRSAEQIAVDTIGIGAGVADMLRAWYPDNVTSKPRDRQDGGGREFGPAHERWPELQPAGVHGARGAGVAEDSVDPRTIRN